MVAANTVKRGVLRLHLLFQRWGQALSPEGRVLLTMLPAGAGLLVSLVLWLRVPGVAGLWATLGVLLFTAAYALFSVTGFFLAPMAQQTERSLATLQKHRQALQKQMHSASRMRTILASEYPLHSAAAWLDKDATELLLSQGAAVDARDETAWPPLVRAVTASLSELDMNERERKRKDVVEVLLTCGADANARHTGAVGEQAAALHWAAERDDKDIAELLLSNGAYVNATTTEGWTPLAHAAGGSKEVVNLLLAHGARVNTRDEDVRTPLHEAAEASRGSKEMTEMLLASGADVNATDEDGRTPLHEAVRNVAYFGGASDNDDLLEILAGEAQLDMHLQPWAKDLIKLLIAAGANIDARDNRGCTPLREAVELAREGGTAFAAQVADLLRQHGAKE